MNFFCKKSLCIGDVSTIIVNLLVMTGMPTAIKFMQMMCNSIITTVFVDGGGDVCL